MSNFVKQGNTFKVIPTGALDIRNQLPVGTYTVAFNSMTGEYSLVSIPDISINHKLYGNVEQRCDRILNTFMAREGGTGVLLLGRKGTGKTMLSKRISEKARDLGALTIVVNERHAGEGFNRFLTDIVQPCVIIFDEFEKVYPVKTQNELLTLFDGVYPTKKLFLVTSNNKNGLSQYMMGRPGRLFYRWEYKGIPEEEVREYLTDTLNNKGRVEEILNSTVFIKELSYDILKAVVEEVNRYPDIQLKELIDPLNIESGGDEEVWILVEGEFRKPSLTKPGDVLCGGSRFNPFITGVWVTVKQFPLTDGKAKMGEYLQWKPEDIVKHTRDVVTFMSDNGTIVIKKKPEKKSSRFEIGNSHEDDDLEYDDYVETEEATVGYDD